MASRDDLAGLEADLKAASQAYEDALKVLRWRQIMGGGPIKSQQAHVARLNHDRLRAELALDRARRTGVQ